LPFRTNFDMGLFKRFAIKESTAVEFRWETFNTFNHTQFFGPAAVNGDRDRETKSSGHAEALSSQAGHLYHTANPESQQGT
jgi:hypothetical protein